jgi:hypothetical protein
MGPVPGTHSPRRETSLRLTILGPFSHGKPSPVHVAISQWLFRDDDRLSAVDLLAVFFVVHVDTVV